MGIQSLKDLYFDQLRDLYDAESRIIDAMPEMIEAASSEELRSALQGHLEETRGQQERLVEIFDPLGEDPSGETCEGMRGLLEEGSEMIGKSGDPDAVDAGIIAAAQRVEHYEIAGYGTARAYAERLGSEYRPDLLQETLEEESAADEELTRIATENINRQAQAEVRG